MEDIEVLHRVNINLSVIDSGQKQRRPGEPGRHAQWSLIAEEQGTGEAIEVEFPSDAEIKKMGSQHLRAGGCCKVVGKRYPAAIHIETGPGHPKAKREKFRLAVEQWVKENNEQ